MVSLLHEEIDLDSMVWTPSNPPPFSEKVRQYTFGVEEHCTYEEILDISEQLEF